MGTFLFYSPEMLALKKDEHGNYLKTDGKANDIWALGVTFFKLLTGRYPFKDTDCLLELKELV